jgi:hypothetical protein
MNQQFFGEGLSREIGTYLEKRAELYSLGKIHGFLHDQRRSLSRSSKFNGFSA